MKISNKSFLAIAAAGIVMAACAKEKLVDTRDDNVEYLNGLTIELGQEEDSKMDASFDASGAHFNWTDGDIIYMMPNNTGTKVYLYSYDAASDKFISSSPAPVTAEGYFVAYCKFGKVSNAGGKAQFVISDKSCTLATLPMISEVSTGTKFHLYHTMGLLEIPVYSSASSTYFYKANLSAGANFTGTFTASPSDTPSVTFTSGAKSFVVFRESDDQIMPTSSSSALSVFVPMVAGSYSSPSVDVYIKSNHLLYKTTQSSSNTLTIQRGKITKAGAVKATTSTKYTPKPAKPNNNVVGHRCGSKECGKGDNTFGSLDYAMFIGCYGVELDVYITKDSKVLVTHASFDDNSSDRVAGLIPSENTFEAIRKAGQMQNGEEYKTLEQYLEKIMDERYCTKLILDAKMVRISGSTKTALTVSCAKKCIDIIKSYNAANFVEMQLSSTISSSQFKEVTTYGKNNGFTIIGINNLGATDAANWGAVYGNPCAKNFSSTYGGSGSLTPDGYKNKGIECTVFNVDKCESGDDNAVYSKTAWNAYKKNASKFRWICTNYPNWLITYLEKTTDETEFSGGSGTASDPYIIATPADFARFVGKTNSKTTYLDYVGKHYRQIANLNMSGYTLLPCCNAKDRAFTGSYDGGGFRIYNYVQHRKQDNVGFWSWVNGGEVKNLTIGSKDGKTWDGVSALSLDCVDKASSYGTWHYVGTFCRLIGTDESLCRLTNVHSFIHLTIPTSTDAKIRLGGLCAIAQSYSHISSCSFGGDVRHTPNPSCAGEQIVGGVMATAEGPENTMDNCVNRGDVYSNHYKTTAVAGVVANSPASTGTQVISNCTNYGTIEHAGVDVSNAVLSAGGVLGYMNGPQANTYVGCNNYGTVITSGSAIAGGVLARPAGMPVNLKQCNNYGTVKCTTGEIDYGERYVGGVVSWISNGTIAWECTIEDCHNYGTVQTDGETLMMGGIAGRIAIVNVKNCSNEGDVKYCGDGQESSARNCNIGGIVGQCYNNTVITSCTNSGYIYSDKVGANRLGGIAGTIRQSTVTSCVNTGAIEISATDATDKWSIAGGVVGFIDIDDLVSESCSITKCSNIAKTDMSISMLTRNENNGFGGIVGMCYCPATISENTNTTNINVVNEGEGGLFVGGILGQSRANAMSAFTANVNKGNLYAEHTDSEGTSLSVGGIIGRNEVSTCPTGNKSLGASISGYNASGSGENLGAVCGWCASMAAIANTTVSGKVNGVTLSAENVETYKCGNADGMAVVTGTVYGTN